MILACVFGSLRLFCTYTLGRAGKEGEKGDLWYAGDRITPKSLERELEKRKETFYMYLSRTN